MNEQELKRQEEKLREFIELVIKDFNKETGKIIDRISISPIYKSGTREILSYSIKLIIRGRR